MLRQPTRLSAPVQAHPVTEATHSASATIGSAGGTVSAKAADGTRFQLQIPARSLAADTLITVSPLSSLTSARWAGKLVGAVQLAPEGLQLAHGALLTMMPKTRVPLANQVAVSYTGNGANLHKVPLAPSRRAIQIPLTHFSGAGVGNAAGGSGAPSPAAGSVVDAYDSQGAGIMEQYRAGNVSKSDAEAAMGSVLNAMYKAIMATEVPPGMNDDAAAQRAIADLLHCAYLADLFGISDNATAQVAPTIGKLEDGIYNRAQAKCADQHDLAQTTTIIKADHDEQLIGLRGHTTAEDFKCMRFRVDFDSLITITNPPAAYSGHYQLEYVAHPTISFSGVSPANGAVFEGSTTARYATAGGTMFFTSQPTDYMTIQSATPAAFTVDGFSIDHHPQNPVLTLALATPTELQYNHYSDGTSFTNTTELWMTSWATIHEDAAVPGAGDAWALTLHPGSGSLIARGSWSGSTDWGSPGGTRADEATTIDVIHTPNG